MQLWHKIVVAMIAGVLTGVVLKEHALWLEPIGKAFLNLIRMIIVPLVLSSMTLGITSIHDPQKLGRIGLKSLFLYLTTTLIAILIGLSFAYIFEPGASVKLNIPATFHNPPSRPIGDILLDIIPKNPIEAMVNENVLQIIVFSLFLGISINFAGASGRALLDLLESLSEVMFRLTSIVMGFSPIGVFAIMASVVGTHGIFVLFDLAKFLTLYIAACLLHFVVIDLGMIYFLAKLNPYYFLKGMGDAMSFAFSTSSSSASLPVTMHCVQKNLGVSKNISSFVLPLGSTVNMNGAAIFQAMSALFVAQMYGLHLTLQQLLTIVMTATLSAIGAAGIPGSGFLMLSVVLSSVGLPVEGLALLAGIDRFRDMFSTVLNVMGDATCAVFIAKQEGELDERQYYHAELVELEGSDI